MKSLKTSSSRPNYKKKYEDEKEKRIKAEKSLNEAKS